MTNAQTSSTSPTQGTVIRDVVLASVDSTGKITSTKVAELVRLEGTPGSPATVTISPQELGSIRSLSGFSGPANSSGSLVWRATVDKDIVSLASTTKSLPVAASFRYYLNGKQVSATSLKGASGLVRIEIDVRNNAYTQKTLTFIGANHKQQSKTVKFYLPFEYTVLVNFPGTMWENLNAPLAYVQTDARGSQNVIRPGVLNPVVGPDHDTVVFEAQGRNVQLPHFQVAFFPRGDPLVKAGIQEQIDGLAPLSDGLGLISENMSKVESGTLQLGDGLKQILAGIGTRDPRTGKAVVTLDASGNPTTLMGGIGFIQDAIKTQLLPGIGTRSSSGRATTSVDSKGVPQTLLYGLQYIKDSIDDAKKQVTDGAKQLIVALNTNFRDGLVQLKNLAAFGQDPALQLAANSDPVVDTARSNLNAIWLAIGGRLPGMPPCTTRTCLLTGLGTVGKNGQPIIHLDSKGQPDTILGGLGQVAYGNPNFNKRQAALGGRTPHDYLKECPYCWEKGRAVYNPATANPKFQPYLSDGLSLLSEGLGDVIKQVQTLDASNPGLVEGLRQMNTGLGTMLAGVQSFDPKNPGLVDGLQQVLTGVGQLSSGVSQLKTQGVDAAAKGVSGGVDDVQLRKAIIA
ncbi:MAG: hypothetical protein ACXVD8_04120, partial [Actinomycetota bacterium]